MYSCSSFTAVKPFASERISRSTGATTSAGGTHMSKHTSKRVFGLFVLPSSPTYITPCTLKLLVG